MMTTLLILIAGFVFAADQKTNQSEKKLEAVSDAARAVEDLAIAARLAEYGKRVGNPVALLGAAQIMKNTPTQDKKREKKSEGTATESQGDKKGKLDTADALLAQAKSMAEHKGMDAVAELVEHESQTAGHKGRVYGPARTVEVVQAHDTDVYYMKFRGGEEATILLIGDGDCDLDLYIYDDNGNLIESDTDSTDRCLISWVPRWTGRSKIKIKNLDDVYAEYILASN